MAQKKLLYDLDLNGNQLKNFTIDKLVSDPTGVGLYDGRVWYNTTDNVFRARINGETLTYAFNEKIPDKKTIRLTRNGTMSSPQWLQTLGRVAGTNATKIQIEDNPDGSIKTYYLKSLVFVYRTSSGNSVPEIRFHKQSIDDVGNVTASDPIGLSVAGTDAGTTINKGNYRKWVWHSQNQNKVIDSNGTYGIRLANIGSNAGSATFNDVYVELNFEEVI